MEITANSPSFTSTLFFLGLFSFTNLKDTIFTFLQDILLQVKLEILYVSVTIKNTFAPFSCTQQIFWISETIAEVLQQFS